MYVNPLQSGHRLDFKKPTICTQHTAYVQASECITKYEKQYMLDGTLPPPDTLCEVDQPNYFILAAEQAAATGSP